VYVDIVSKMLGPDGKPPADLFVQDGLHLSPKGYAIWNAELKRVMKE
jgi:lysophospholipase L1-like esterase